MARTHQPEAAPPRYTTTAQLTDGKAATVSTSNQLSKCVGGASNYAFVSPWYDQENDGETRNNLYQSQYQSSAVSWKPNIAASCASTTDNHSKDNYSKDYSKDNYSKDNYSKDYSNNFESSRV